MQSKGAKIILKFVVASLWIFGSLIGSARAQEELIVTGKKIINSRVRSEFVDVSECIPVSQLKRRFARYKVVYSSETDCLICANVYRNALQFDVHYDEDGISVIAIYCRNNKCVDALGHRVGGPLRQALGSQADCDSGDELICKSDTLPGLSYIVGGNNECTLQVIGNGKKQIFHLALG
jgi:hypothetical protein